MQKESEHIHTKVNNGTGESLGWAEAKTSDVQPNNTDLNFNSLQPRLVNSMTCKNNCNRKSKEQ